MVSPSLQAALRLYPALRVCGRSIAVQANHCKLARGKAAARAMKVPLYVTPAGSILRRILEDEA
jgi:hypothetical protein